jgi:hypothetical protein
MRTTIIRAIFLALAMLCAGGVSVDARERRLADPTPWDWIFDDADRGTGWRDPRSFDPWSGRGATRAADRINLSGVSECEYPCGAIR